jgi:hypothetical protein
MARHVVRALLVWLKASMTTELESYVQKSEREQERGRLSLGE